MAQRTRSNATLIPLAVVVALLFPAFAPLAAQNALAITVTPPLIQLTIGPGEFWASTIKVVNSNPYDVSFYTGVVDVEAKGERGESKFVPVVKEFDKEEQTYSLGSWIEVAEEPIVIGAGRSGVIPFSVRVPENAEPGGHYAAILVGTKPPKSAMDGATISVSSYVSSLIFVRITGDVVESGRIREFTSDQSLYQTPSADFSLRFENTGNVHLRPEGFITLYNFWGKERGSVPINGENYFGNVLPKSIRKFSFSWEGEQSPLDIGRYKAVATITYGDDSKKNTTAATYFWVVPLVPVSATLGAFLSFIVLMVWLIRRYIRRALQLEQRAISNVRNPSPSIAPSHAVPQGDVPLKKLNFNTLVQPLREGAVDLRNMKMEAANREGWDFDAPLPREKGIASSDAAAINQTQTLSVSEFVGKYKLFFLFLAVVIIAVTAFFWYLDAVLVAERQFEITDIRVQEESSLQTHDGE